jgi:hypothetical protein
MGVLAASAEHGSPSRDLLPGTAEARRDVRAGLLRESADHDDGQPVRDPRREPRRHRGSAHGVRRVFSFKARQRLDVHAEHDILDEGGRPLGWFKKDFAASLLRSTWHLSGPGIDAVGQERRPLLAILRRIWDFIPWLGEVWVPFVFHFDFVDTRTGAIVLVSERQKAIRDRYAVTVPDPRLDFRVAASMAVALDALQSR